MARKVDSARGVGVITARNMPHYDCSWSVVYNGRVTIKTKKRSEGVQCEVRRTSSVLACLMYVPCVLPPESRRLWLSNRAKVRFGRLMTTQFLDILSTQNRTKDPFEHILA